MGERMGRVKLRNMYNRPMIKDKRVEIDRGSQGEAGKSRASVRVDIGTTVIEL